MNKFVALSALLAFAVAPIVQAALQHGQNNQQKQNKKDPGQNSNGDNKRPVQPR
ncbi:hypothetical protein [Mangrovibacter phragmitis]|jgi:quinol-cytochrome oxidoreductase complex cytochrome b subunit|uniref:hypothetical protein n=1 Tax=Mangrovibacter phragmitis TaxID=1691903 RepID=UPI0012E8FFC5|nr:hypothetical protein [Mangrovibacter phragmitis]